MFASPLVMILACVGLLSIIGAVARSMCTRENDRVCKGVASGASVLVTVFTLYMLLTGYQPTGGMGGGQMGMGSYR